MNGHSFSDIYQVAIVKCDDRARWMAGHIAGPGPRWRPKDVCPFGHGTVIVMMRNADAILSATELVYGAVRDPAAWPSAMTAIATAVGGGASGFVMSADASGREPDVVTSFGIDPASQASMAAMVGTGALPPFLNAVRAGVAHSSATLIEDRVLEQADYYNDIMRPRGCFYGVLAMPQATRRITTYVAVSQAHRAGPYDAGQTAGLQALVPHLATALELRNRLREADLRAAGAHRALDQVSAGIILADATGRPCFINSAAQAILDDADGLRLTLGGMAAAIGRQTEMMRRLIVMAAPGAASDGAAGGLLLTRPSGRPALVMRVMPLSRVDLPVPGRQQPAVAIFIRAPDRRRTIDADLLAEAYALTPREAELAVLLAHDASLAEAAARLDISLDTARTYLKRALDKTDTHRQAELVSLILRAYLDP